MAHTIRPVMRAVGVAGVVAIAASLGSAQAQDAEALLGEKCSVCHAAEPHGGLERISAVRKTPEGWFMNIFRMQNLYGVELTGDERQTLVKYLSDSYGLAPSESEGYRYVLERVPGAIDSAPNDDLAAMCGRCHTYARVALQRRDEDEWRKLAHFHLGQFPTTEYQALGRDRDWFGIATNDVPPELAKLLPLETDAWASWKDRAQPDMSGIWIVVGRQPGKGFYDGSMQVTKTGDDEYETILALQYADGSKAEHLGNAIVYTGHEWRASKTTPQGKGRQVLGASEDGNAMTGRWFLRDSDVIGGSIHAVNVAGAEPQIMAVNPPYIRQGISERVTIIGVGMEGEPNLGDGISVDNIIAQSSEKIIAEVSAAGDTVVGPRGVSVGDAGADGAFVVYDKIDNVLVVPQETIARVGGGGGPIPIVPAQFEAVAYMAGGDGEAGTDDDIRIGIMPAAWSVDNFDEFAAALKDAEFAGAIDDSGLFTPGVAGPNPERPMSTNNAGNLTVVGTVDDNGNAVAGTAHLYVTVQRFVDPPIR